LSHPDFCAFFFTHRGTACREKRSPKENPEAKQISANIIKANQQKISLIKKPAALFVAEVNPLPPNPANPNQL